MKLFTWGAVYLVGASLAAQGAMYTEGPYTAGFANGGNIPDGSTAGWSDTRTIGDIPTSFHIREVSVSFTISGGYNGDLYGYLSYNGALIPLLNRVGLSTGAEPTYSFGYGDSGFNSVTLADSGSVDIHNYGGTGVPTGTYKPDSGGVTFENTFAGMTANGTWTLFFSDLSSGGGQSQLASWSLQISDVPEPVNVALSVFGGILALGVIGRSQPVRDRLQRWKAAFVEWVNAV